MSCMLVFGASREDSVSTVEKFDEFSARNLHCNTRGQLVDLYRCRNSQMNEGRLSIHETQMNRRDASEP